MQVTRKSHRATRRRYRNPTCRPAFLRVVHPKPRPNRHWKCRPDSPWRSRHSCPVMSELKAA